MVIAGLLLVAWRRAGQRAVDPRSLALVVGGVMTTAGGLVFFGTPEGEFVALDDATDRLYGSTRLEASCGLFALVCSNGLVISRLHFGEVSLRHAGKFSQYDAMSAIMEFEKKMADIRDHVENFSGILLTQVEQETFARVAATARWGQEVSSKMDVAQLLHRNRSEDDSNTLWATFNTLQENVIGGSARVGSRRSRPMKEMTRTQDLNQALWHGMETFAMNGTFSLPEGYSLN
jgi:hypothetical protein